MTAPEIEEAVDRIEAAVQKAHPSVKRISIEADAISRRSQRAESRSAEPHERLQ